MVKLYELGAVYRQISDLIEAGEDWADALSAVDDAFSSKVQSAAQMVNELEATATAFATEAARLSGRSKAISNETRRLKDYIASQMEVVGVSHVPGIVDCRLQASNPSIETGPELPDIWVKATLKMPLSDVPQHLYEYLSGSADPDKAGLMALHRDGGTLPPGARVVEGNKHLRLR